MTGNSVNITIAIWTATTKKTANIDHKTIVRRLKKYKRKAVLSITYDNGSENVLHEKTNKQLKSKSYFCEPYHSWEKGKF